MIVGLVEECVVIAEVFPFVDAILIFGQGQ